MSDFTIEPPRKLGRCLAGLRREVHDRYRMGVGLGVFQATVDGPDPDSEILVARDPGSSTPAPALAGFATFYEIDHRRLWLQLLWVDTAYRRRGLARRLLDEVLELARHRRLIAVLLGRSEGNAPMLRLLEQAGWPVDHVVHSLKVRP